MIKLKIMKLNDVIITIIAGESFAVIASQLLSGRHISVYVLAWAFYFLMPVVAVAVLWLADLISKKYFVIYQFAKYCLIGIIATLVDMDIVLFCVWVAPNLRHAFAKPFRTDLIVIFCLVLAAAFLLSTYVKFLGNKYWTFEEKEKKDTKKEFTKFFVVTFLGLLLDEIGFFIFFKLIGPQWGVSADVWRSISVILAALFAAVWNFLGYKIIIFKK